MIIVSSLCSSKAPLLQCLHVGHLLASNIIVVQEVNCHIFLVFIRLWYLSLFSGF